MSTSNEPYEPATKNIATYHAGVGKRPEYITYRNQSLAKYLAQIQSVSYLGGFTLAEATELQGQAIFWVPDGPISQDEAQSLGIIDKSDMYGSISNEIVATKAVVHRPWNLPLSNKGFDFPQSFAHELAKTNTTLPGYTAFSKNDAISAFNELSNRGYEVRTKEPLQTGMEGQTVVKSRAALEFVFTQLNEHHLRKYGLVLEANMINNSNNSITAYSIGRSTVYNKTVSYIGKQKTVVDTFGVMRYGGTSLLCFRGHIVNGNRFILGDTELTLIEKTMFIESQLSLIPDLQFSRLNLNFIEGMIKNESGNYKGLRFLEHTTRVGGASAAEFVALKLLTEDPNILAIELTSNVTYRESPQKFRDDHIIFLQFYDCKLKWVSVWVSIDRIIYP